MPSLTTEDDITREADLVEWIASGAKVPAGRWIGSEHEKFIYRRATRAPLEWRAADGRGLAQFLELLAERGNWEVQREDGEPITLLRDGASVTLEPGGQVELSGAPHSGLGAVAAEIEDFLAEARTLAEEMGLAFLGMGTPPEWPLDRITQIPKGRYKMIRPYMLQRGGMGYDMMHRSCTVQVNLDFVDERDFVSMFRIILGLQPLATALFANSPFLDGDETGYLSHRMRLWQDTDTSRSLPPDFMFGDDAGYERWARYALGVPMYFVRRDGAHLTATGASFSDFMAGREPRLEGVRACLQDWDDHLTTIFTPVRAKRWIEVRDADGTCSGMLTAMAALWVGLLYDDATKARCLELALAMNGAERNTLRAVALRDGMAGAVPGSLVRAFNAQRGVGESPLREENSRVRDLVPTLLSLSQHGLERRGLGEETFLSPLWHLAEAGHSQAERRLALWRKEWGRDFAPLYEDAAC
ncbi:MAG: glutamate-cysteine ligase family protein [Alphaproteobacteria bacterium]